MANAFLKPETIAAQALGLLQREIALTRLVTAHAAADFIGAKDDTVNVKVPAVLTAREQGWRSGSSITVDDITETSVPVVLNKHPYHAGSILDEQLTLDISDFGMQVTMPQVRAVAEKLEGYVAAGIAAAPITNVVEFDRTASDGTEDPYKVLLACNKVLNTNNVPRSERFVVVGADIEEAFLGDDRLSKVNESGSDDALREATVGRIAGFTIVGSNAIAADEAYAFHRSAFVFANVAPAVPAGATSGASTAYEGLAMRWLRDYDSDKLTDRSVVSSFAGFASVDDGPDTGDSIDPDGAADTAPENIRAVVINYTPPA